MKKQNKTKSRVSLKAIDDFKKQMQIVTTVFVIAMFTLHPLIITDKLYGNITDVKLASHIILTTLLAVLTGLAGLLVLLNGFIPGLENIKKWLKKFKPYEIALLCFIVLCFVSALFSDDRQVAFWGGTNRNEGFFIWLSYIFIFFMVSRFYLFKKSHINIFLITANLICIYSICQFYGMDFLNLYFKTGESLTLPVGKNVLFFATMSNKNMLSIYTSLTFSVSAILFVRKQQQHIDWLYFLSAMISIYATICADTESGYVGLLVGFAILFGVIIRDKGCLARFLLVFAGCTLLIWVMSVTYPVFMGNEFILQTSLKNPLLYGAIIFLIIAVIVQKINWTINIPLKTWNTVWPIALLVLIISGLLILPIIAERTQISVLVELNNMLHGELQDEMGSGRIFIWRNALTLIPQKPLLGYGPDNFYRVFTGAFGELGMEKFGVVFDKAHNEFIQLAVDVGLLGLISILSFYALFLLRASKYAEDQIIMTLAVALVAFLVQSFFNFAQPFTTPIVWTLWGIFAARLRFLENQ